MKKNSIDFIIDRILDGNKVVVMDMEKNITLGTKNTIISKETLEKLNKDLNENTKNNEIILLYVDSRFYDLVVNDSEFQKNFFNYIFGSLIENKFFETVIFCKDENGMIFNEILNKDFINLDKYVY